jgi:PAS domain S-box-containing protein
MECGGNAIFWLYRASRIVRMNEASCRALGYTREELLGRHIREIDPNFADPARWQRSWNRAKELGDYVTCESVHRRKDGTLFPVEIVSSPFSYGNREYLLSIVREVSERYAADSQNIQNSSSG